MTHGSIGRFDDEGLLLAFPAQLLYIVLELSVFSREDPGLGYEAVFLRLALDHSGERAKTVVTSHSDHLHLFFITRFVCFFPVNRVERVPPQHSLTSPVFLLLFLYHWWNATS